MKRAVVDASVAVKWVVEEEFSAAAERLLTMGTALHAPAHWLAEASNAIVAYSVFKGVLSADAAREKVAFLTELPVQDGKLQAISRIAADMALDLGVTVYDTLYLALAAELSVPFVTADRKLYDRVRAHGRWGQHLCWVADVPDSPMP